MSDVMLISAARDNSAPSDFLAMMRKHDAWLLTLSLRINAGLLGVVVLLGCAIVIMQPLKQLMPLIVALYPNGSATVVRDLRQVPEEWQIRAIEGTIWSYVVARESYLFNGAPFGHDLVVKLSTKDAAEAFHKWFVDSPDSPQQKIGESGYIRVEQDIDSVQIDHDGKWASVAFWRIEQIYGKPIQRRHYSARVPFIFDKSPIAADRLTNLASLRVPLGYRSVCDSSQCGN